MCAACFGMYLGYPQAGQYKNLTVVMLYNVKTYNKYKTQIILKMFI